MKSLFTLSLAFYCLTLQASIVYTDLVDQVVGPDNISADLDFNQDGLADAVMNYNELDVAIAFYDLENEPLDAGFISTVVIGSFLEIPLNQITPLNLDDPITANENYIQPSQGGINNVFANFAMESIDFPTGQDYYIGARFYLNNELHYGWVRVEIQSDGVSMAIKDYAYNDVPEEGLTAGQTPLINNIVSHRASLELDIFPNPTKDILNIKVEELKLLDYQCSILNLLGEEVRNNLLTDLNTQIDVRGLTQGVYILRVYDQSHSYSRKFVKRD